MSDFLQHLVNGLSIGAIYALIALGYTMVYGVLKLINFAHGDVVMVGAVVAWFLSTKTGAAQAPTVLSAALITLGAMAVCGALGFAIERLAYRPLRGRPRIVALITAIGVSFLLEYGMQLPGLLGAAPQPLRLLPSRPAFELGSEEAAVYVSLLQIVTLVLAVALMMALEYIVYRTRFGRAMRAVSHSADTAALMGIPTDRVISLTFVLGSTLAAAAGVLYGLTYYKVDALMGLLPGLKAFVAAVLGGIGNVPGAMVGGFLMGLAEEFTAGYVTSSYRDAVAFAILIVVLLVRPSGLFGTHAAEKV